MDFSSNRQLAEAVLAVKGARNALKALPQDDNRILHAISELELAIQHAQAALLALDKPRSMYAIVQEREAKRWDRYYAQSAAE